jgi:hypothetical protein
MKRVALLLFLSAAIVAQAEGEGQKMALANRIVNDLLSLGPEADIPVKYSFLYWPALKELSKDSNWPRLELIRDISMVGELFVVWPSRESLVGAVYENMPKVLVQGYQNMTLAITPRREPATGSRQPALSRQ